MWLVIVTLLWIIILRYFLLLVIALVKESWDNLKWGYMYIVDVIFNPDNNRYNGLCNSFYSLFYVLLPMTEDGTTSRRLVWQCICNSILCYNKVDIVHFYF